PPPRRPRLVLLQQQARDGGVPGGRSDVHLVVGRARGAVRRAAPGDPGPPDPGVDAVTGRLPLVVTSVSRSDLAAFLGHARLFTVLGPVDHAGFDPRLATRSDRWIWWTRSADEAFDADGRLVHPVVIHWRGGRARLQVA